MAPGAELRRTKTPASTFPSRSPAFVNARQTSPRLGAVRPRPPTPGQPTSGRLLAPHHPTRRERPSRVSCCFSCQHWPSPFFLTEPWRRSFFRDAEPLVFRSEISLSLSLYFLGPLLYTRIEREKRIRGFRVNAFDKLAIRVHDSGSPLVVYLLTRSR